jgi:hypothetical protein
LYTIQKKNKDLYTSKKYKILFCARARRNHSEDVIFTRVVEEVDGQLGFEGELPTPKSLGERTIRVRVRDGAQKILVSAITVGIPILAIVIHTTGEIRIWT